ncbi:MAG: hypothetical protein AOA65_0263 [Candidatus Bathyarchaeota archaeon BA1]|nr:MAG: hypothetical protein AOA65_0263 [Candidatus Bathyarchaeota archaeon BA1]
MEKAKGSKSLIIAGREVPDPFELDISWTQLTVKEKDQLLSSLESFHSKLIERAFKESPEATVIVLSKGTVVKVYADFISLEELRTLEKKYGAICIPIVNQRKFIIEESTWSDLTAERKGDYYPTVPIVVGDEPGSDPAVFQKGIRATADFDTGNWGVFALPIETCRKIVPIKAEEILFAGRHLERRYYFAVKRLKIGVEDIDGHRRTILKQAFCVEDWLNSPLTATNPNRKAFIGRDVMLDFPFEAYLNPLMHRTTIRLL